jgi:hypothetical protein
MSFVRFFMHWYYFSASIRPTEHFEQTIGILLSENFKKQPKEMFCIFVQKKLHWHYYFNF